MESLRIQLTKSTSASVEVLNYSNIRNIDELRQQISDELGISRDAFYMTQNGKIVEESTVLVQNEIPIMVFPRVLGGKGGFGSMLRAIGAQIEKTTNRDACRDLSGRRLRDINEEQRLKRWFSKQSEREQEKIEAKKRKLEKLKQVSAGPPLPLVDDQDYNKQRADMADSVFEAVDKGFEHSGATKSSLATSEASSSSLSEAEEQIPSSSSAIPSIEVSSSTVVKAKVTKTEKPKKMKKLMMDEDFETDSDCSSQSDDETAAKKSKIS